MFSQQYVFSLKLRSSPFLVQNIYYEWTVLFFHGANNTIGSTFRFSFLIIKAFLSSRFLVLGRVSLILRMVVFGSWFFGHWDGWYASPFTDQHRGGKEAIPVWWGRNGWRYLDAFGGIATVCCGHCHPDVVSAIAEQMNRLQHSTVLYLNHAITNFCWNFI